MQQKKISKVSSSPKEAYKDGNLAQLKSLEEYPKQISLNHLEELSDCWSYQVLKEKEYKDGKYEFSSILSGKDYSKSACASTTSELSILSDSYSELIEIVTTTATRNTQDELRDK